MSNSVTDENQIVESDWAIKNVVQDVGEAMDALCANKAFDMVTVAGKSVMKVFAIKNNEFEQVLDLRSKVRGTTFNFLGSISWSPVNENLIAATSSVGSIGLFDLEHCGNNSQGAVKLIGPGNNQLFRSNKTAATKVCFHNYDAHVFVSASKDATLSIHDYRVDNPVVSFALQGGSIDSIRDLQFCLDREHQDIVVTGGDSGIVRFWDKRQPGRYLKKCIGNTSNLSSLALNPDPDNWNYLATVGHDRFIRIWDWSFDNPQTLHTIETPTIIGRVRWDPRTSYIATTTNRHDHQLLLWSYKRPAFPLMTFRGHASSHTSNISDMAFPRESDEAKFVTCGKDRRLILHFMDYGDSAMEITPPISMATGPHNELFTSYPKEYLNGNLVAEFDYSQTVEPVFVQYPDQLLPYFNASDNLVKLAKAYKFTGDNPVRICNWNAHVNKRLDNFSLAYTWKAIGILIQQADIQLPRSEYDFDDKYFEYIADPTKPKQIATEKPHEEEDDWSASDTEQSQEAGAFSQNFKDTCLENDFFYGVDEFKMKGMPGGRRFLDFIQQMHESQMKTDLVGTKEEAILPYLNLNDEDSDSNSELDPSDGSNERVSSVSDSDDGSVGDRSASPALLSSGESILETDGSTNGDSELPNWINSARVEQYFTAASQGSGADNWGPLSLLRRLINAYSDISDSQTCATVCLILGKYANQLFGNDQVSAWFFHYIEMLQDAGNNELATFIAKRCACDEVIRGIQENMHVKFFCANCFTAAPSGRTSCEKCGTAFATVCTACDHEVRGLFAQCNDCGHGGHAPCLETWFCTFGICAFPGCMHVCVPAEAFRTTSKDSDLKSSAEAGSSSKPLLFCGDNVFTNADNEDYYRDEEGEIKPLPKTFLESLPVDRKVDEYYIEY